MSATVTNIALVPAKPAPAKSTRFKLLTLDDLKALPQPEWLIKGIFRAQSQVVLYGQSGHGKSFVALDMALSIATGRSWLGHATTQGPVVYVVSEGGRGTHNRVVAWMEGHQVTDITGAFFVLDAVQLTEEKDVEEFLKRLGELEAQLNQRAKLIVLDTFARSFVGGEENSAKEVGVWVEASRQIQERTGATVMAVHHTGKLKDGGTSAERGSSALRAAAETMISVTADGDAMIISCSKQKEDEQFRPLRLRQKQMELGEVDGEPITSLVLEAVEGTSAGDVGDDTAELSIPLRRALDALRALPSSQGRSGEWQAAITIAGGTTVPDTTFHRWRRALVSRGLVEQLPEETGFYRAVSPTAVVPEVPPEEGHTGATTSTPL